MANTFYQTIFCCDACNDGNEVGNYGNGADNQLNDCSVFEIIYHCNNVDRWICGVVVSD